MVAWLLAGCAATGGERGVPYQLSGEDVAVVESGVRNGLKDPESARYGAMFAAVDKSGVVSVCGIVNARNSFGGYTGGSLFIGRLTHSPTTFRLIGFGLVRPACIDAGVLTR